MSISLVVPDYTEVLGIDLVTYRVSAAFNTLPLEPS